MFEADTGAQLIETRSDSSWPFTEVAQPLSLPSSTPRANASAGAPITIALVMAVLPAPVAASKSMTTSPSAIAVAFSVMDTLALQPKQASKQTAHTPHESYFSI
jgi:hypothetical protein